MNALLTLAQAAAAQAPAATQAATTATAPAASTTPPPGGEWTQIIIMIVAFIAVMYFLMIRPQKKQQNARNQMLAAIKVGDQIMTTSGIFGKIAKVQDKTYIIEIADNTRIEILHAAVGEVINANEMTEAK